MKQYDKIYIPEKCKPNEMHMAIIGDSRSLTEQINVIVLTIEELRETFKEGYNEGKLYEESADDAFEAYVKKMGIKL